MIRLYLNNKITKVYSILRRKKIKRLCVDVFYVLSTVALESLLEKYKAIVRPMIHGSGTCKLEQTISS